MVIKREEQENFVFYSSLKHFKLKQNKKGGRMNDLFILPPFFTLIHNYGKAVKFKLLILSTIVKVILLGLNE